MRHHQKMRVRAAICRIAAVSLVLQTILPGAVPAEEILPGTVSAEETRPETAPIEKILPESEITIETETESMEPRERVVISEARDLDELAKRCAVDVNSAHLEVVLTADISMAGRKFTPIPFFSGIFDGQGHTIRGIGIRADGSDQGLFRYTGKEAVIRNLHAEGWLEPGGSALEVGGIVGSNAGTIQNCSFKGTVRAKEDGGGIAGVNEENGTICGCLFEGKVVAQHRAGGIAGRNNGSILSCANQGEVNTEYIETDEETKTSLTANLTNLSSFDVSSVKEEDFVDIMDIGGIAGYSEGLISGCRGSGTVGYAHTGYNVGGIVGRASGFTVDCTNEGAVYGRKDVGGVLGQLEPESIWEYSKSQIQELKAELIRLNELIDALAEDTAGSADSIRDDVHTASGYAADTIRDLQGVTDEIGVDVEKVSAAITEAMGHLSAAFDEKSAEKMQSALAELAQIISTTDFFRLPVYVTVKSDTKSELSSVLDAKEKDWWKKLDEYLNSREKNTRQGGILPVQVPGGSGRQSSAAVSDADPGALTAQGDGALPEEGDLGDGIIEDASAGSDDTVDAGWDDAADTGWDDTASAGWDDVSDAGYDDTASAGWDDTADTGWDDAVYEEEGDGGILPEEDAADVVPQESVLTGAGMEDGGETALFMDSADSGEAGIIEDGSTDTQNAQDTGEGVLDVSLDAERNLQVGDTSVIDRTKDKDVQVSVNTDLPDTAQLRSLLNAVLTDGAALLDPASLSNAAQVLRELEITAPDTSAFYQSFANLAASITPLADDAGALTRKASKDIDAITDQLDQIIETFFSLTQDISLDDQYEQTDVSRQNPYRSDSSSAQNCRNLGDVNGDTNTGGITGCIGFESKIDKEGVLDVSEYLLKNAKYTIFAAVRGCYNRGPVTAKKETAGGIAGYMEFGIVTDSANTGAVTVQEGGFCGGISGKSLGTITDCCAGSLLTGGACTGGIAGQGTDISNCIAYCYIDSTAEHLGAVAGMADGKVDSCRYVDYGIGGIDNVGYAAAARPIEGGPVQAASTEAENSTSAEDGAERIYAGNTCTVTFVVEGEVYKEISVPFGGGLESLPEVPNRGDDYWQWEEFDQEHIFSSQTVEGSYHRPTTTLADGGDVPQYLVEGTFYEGQKLKVTDFVPQISPVSTESIADIIGDKIHGGNETEADVDQADTEAEETAGRIARARQELKRIITDQLTGPLLDAKTLSVNDYDKVLTVRVKAAGGGRLFTFSQDGTLQESAYTKDGSYIVFPLENGGSFAYYESLRQNKDMRGRIALVCGITAAILIVLILLIRRRRKKKKQKKQMQQKKQQKK